MKVGPLEFSAPTWDGKLVLAGIFILGYYGLVYALVLGSTTLSDNKAQMVRDAMLALSPVVGLIFGSLFRSTAADERTAARRDEALKTAIETPSLVAAPLQTQDLGNQVREGAEDGARAGVADGLTGNSAGGSPPVDDPEPEILR